MSEHQGQQTNVIPNDRDIHMFERVNRFIRSLIKSNFISKSVTLYLRDKTNEARIQSDV